MRSASAASTRRPVSISSSARFGGHRPEHRHGDHVRPQAEPDLGGAEHGVVGRHHEVARQRQPEPAGEGVAAHPGDGGLAERVEVAEEVGQLAPAVVQLGEPGAGRHALEVGAGAERLGARAGEHDHPHLVVGLGGRRARSRSSPISAHDSALRRSSRSIVRCATCPRRS